MSPPLGSVVIPAHDESAVIVRCLSALLEDTMPGDLEVVVVANGCRDDTVDRARRVSGAVDVVEIAAASKPAALRAGDRRVHAFPRLYLDADVVVPGRAARTLLARLRHGTVPAVRPPIRYEVAAASAVVQRYYRARAALPTVMSSLWGAGVYGLSEAGRSRFGEFPDVVADDLFVASQFRPDEIEIVDCEPATVWVPRRTGDLLRVVGRTHRGAREQRGAGSGAAPATARSTLRDVTRLRHDGPVATIDAAVYATVAVLARCRTPRRDAPWERDETSRTA